MLPNAFIIGVQKSGTTFLAHLLMQHPDICFSKKKELHFFSKEHNRKKGMDFYEKCFEPYNGEKVIMEGTPGYMASEMAMKDISDSLGSDMKILVIMRDPVKRLVSQYRMRYSIGGERRSLDDAVSHFLSVDRTDFRNYINRGLYYDQLKMVEKYFPKENINVSVFEDFISNPAGKIKDILDFLGVDCKFEFNFESGRNPGRNSKPNLLGRLFYLLPRLLRYKYLSSLSAEGKSRFFKLILSKNKKLEHGEISDDNMEKLRELYKPQIDKLEIEYGLDLSCWDSIKK